MDAGKYVAILRQGWLVLLIATVLGATLGGLYTLTQEPQYSSTAKMYFSITNAQGGTDLTQGANYAESAATSYAEMAKLEQILGPVRTTLNLEQTPAQIARWVTTDVVRDAQILEVTVSHPDAQLAAELANAIAGQVQDTAGQLSPKTPENRQMISVTIVSNAVKPVAPYAPSLQLNVIFGMIAALGGAVAFLVLRELMDTRVRDEQVLTKTVTVPMLASVPDDPDTPARTLISGAAGTGRAEAFRQLRTNLQYIDFTGGLRSLVITSSTTGEGKTSTAINLAEATTALGVSVLLIDADLRRPRVHEILGIDGSVGLSTVLAGLADPREVVQQYGDKGMYVLPAGHVPPNPSELLGSQSMAHLLNELSEIFDLVILDAAPVLPVTDPTVLSMLTDGAVLVVNAKHTTRAAVTQAAETLRSAGVTLLGTVLNQAPKRQSAYYHIDAPAPEVDRSRRWSKRKADAKRSSSAREDTPPAHSTGNQQSPRRSGSITPGP